jgi:hypothetical protein
MILKGANVNRKTAWAGAVVLALAAASVGVAHFAAAESTDSVHGSNALLSWSIPDVPEAGLTNLTFPITINEGTERVEGTYFAQVFGFTDADEVGYTGLQPRADQDGRQRLHAVFSSFIAGTASSDPNCREGADEGPGVSCASDFDGIYGHEYAITVEQTGADTWSGTALDTVTGASSHIGTYTLPAGSGSLKGSQNGFVEYYLPVPSCDQVQAVDVLLGAPTTTDAGGLAGSTWPDGEWRTESCHGEYTTDTVDGSAHVTRGVSLGGAPSSKPAIPCSRNPRAEPCAAVK